MAMSAATLEEIEGVKVSPTQQTRMFESSYNGSAAAGSAVPYDLWSSCSESEAADIPMIVPPPSLDSSNPTPPAKKKLKVTFSETIRICESASNQDSYQSPNLNSQHLQQKVLLAKAASHLRAQLQVYYRQGRLLNLTKRDIDDHVLPYCFDGLGDTLQALVQRVNNVDTASDSSDQCPVPQKPQLNETEKSLVRAFKATWKQVPHGRGAPTTVILSWFNESLLRAGLPIWRQKGRRWTYVQYKLGLEKSLGWVPPGHAQRRQMSSPLTPYKTVSPLRNDFSPIYGQMHV